MKRILIIGDADSVYMKQYIEELLKYRNDCKIYLLTRNYTKFLDYYEENRERIEIIHYIRNGIRLYCFLLQTKHQVKSYGVDFDYIHVHFIDRVVLNLAKVLATENTKIIASYWGSDIFRKTKKAFQNEEPLLEGVSYITFITNDMWGKFREEYGTRFDHKCLIRDFGISLIDVMGEMYDKNSELSLLNESKESFGIPKESVVVAVGYNAIEEQQHLKVLEAIKRLPKEISKKVYVLLHMSYGVTTERYKESVIKAAESIGCGFCVIEDFLQGEKLVKLRMAVDIYINAQKTDALSATMLEYLYAGKVVMNPIWLPYAYLDTNHIEYLLYHDFSELTCVLKEALTKTMISDEKKKRNRQILYQDYSWSNAIKLWNQLYN